MKMAEIGQIIRMKNNHFKIKEGRIGLIVNQSQNYSGSIKYNEFGIYFPDKKQYKAWIYGHEFEIIADPIKSYRG